MKRRVVMTSSFVNSLRKFTKRNPSLRQRIEETIRKMEIDVYAPELAAHKLKGKLHGLLACSCGYDCRIMFTVENYQQGLEEVILLIKVGTHKQVY
jgi:mRNA interferase YafQ